MGIVLKYLLRNVGEKKLRTALIIIAITVSSALFFATNAMSTTIEEMYSQRLKQFFGTAEIVMSPKRTAGTNFFSPELVEPFSDRLLYAVGSVRTGGKIKNTDEEVDVTLHAFDFPGLQEMNPISIVREDAILPFKGKKAIIGEHTANRFDLDIGSNLRLEFAGGIHRFHIAAIARSEGFFTDDGQSNAILVPLSTVATYFKFRGRVGMLYMKAKNPEDSQTLIDDMSAAFRRYHVRETVSEEDKKEWARSMTVPFKVMLVLVVSISVFIIFTCFQVITTERLPVIGTFRSIGATRKTTDILLLSESLVYGIVGGLLGCFLGLGILNVLVRVSTSGWLSQAGIFIKYSFGQLVTSFSLAIFLSGLSSAVPIIRVSKIPVKDIILNIQKRKPKKTKIKYLIAGPLIIIGLIIPAFIPRELALIIDTVCIIGLLIGVTLLIPPLTSFFSALFEKTYILIFGNTGILAAKNLKNNQSILNNISLLCIGISGIFMISTISHSAVVSLSNFYRHAEYEIQVWTWPANRNTELRLRAVRGVEETLGYYSDRDVEIDGREERISFVQGVRPERFNNYWNYNYSANKDKLLEELDAGRNIILSLSLKRRLKLDEGDSLFLDFSKRKREYRVIGFVDSLQWNGSYAIVSDRYLKMDSGRTTYDSIYVQTNEDPDAVRAAITKKFERRRPNVRTVAEMEEQNMQSNSQIFSLLQSFSYLAMLIGTVGVVNNFIISFIERKRSIALYRSIGMSKKQTIAMLFIEAATGGIIGSLIGLTAGLLMLIIIPQMLHSMDLPISIFISPLIAMNLIFTGIFITTAASIAPAFKSSKLNIIEAIKYE